MNDLSVESLNDDLAREYSINDYYNKSPLPIRMIEQKRLSIIRNFAGPSSRLEIAEIGSGGGHVLRMFPDARLTAIDVSSVYLETARQNLQGYNVQFIKGEVDKLDLPANSFDRVICTEVLEHTVDPEAILQTIAGLLRSDGVAIITVPNDPLIMQMKTFLKWTPVGWMLRKRINWGGDQYHIHHWKPEEFRTLLSKYMRVTHEQHAPFHSIPLRACFRCVRM